MLKLALATGILFSAFLGVKALAHEGSCLVAARISAAIEEDEAADVLNLSDLISFERTEDGAIVVGSRPCD